jgi:hypothetical protein
VKSLRTRLCEPTLVGSHGSAAALRFCFNGFSKQDWEFSWCSEEKTSSDLAVVGGFR